MEQEENKRVERKKYWLKLDKDFLKSPQMKVIKAMPNGKDYIIFYLSLMLESVETVGHLRFTSLVPYNDEMLSAITETNVDIVRTAIKIFCELGLMQIFDDGTIFIPEVPKITGKESESAERVRKFRAKQNQELLQCNTNVTKCNGYIEEEKDKNKDKNKEIIKRNFIKPTIEEIETYCKERNNGINANAFYDFYESKNWYVGKNKMKDWKACVRTWEQRSPKKTSNVPQWFDKEIKKVETTTDEIKEMEELLKEYKKGE